MAEIVNNRDSTLLDELSKVHTTTMEKYEHLYNEYQQLKQEREKSDQQVIELRDQVSDLQQQLKETKEKLQSQEEKVTAISAEFSTLKEAMTNELARLPQHLYAANANNTNNDQSDVVLACSSTPLTGQSSPHPIASTSGMLVNGSTTDTASALNTNTAIGSPSGSQFPFALPTTTQQTPPFAQSQPQNVPATSHASSMRTIPAPSKVMVNDQKKKDNRLVELKKITKQYMNVSDEEAALRLYKLQKTMIHVVSDLKKYMKERNEDISKSWKTIDMSTQRVAFEMVEREATSLGVPLNRCIGYWGARRLISKSWANALRTTKKHLLLNNQPQQQPQQLAPSTAIYSMGQPSTPSTYDQASSSSAEMAQQQPQSSEPYSTTPLPGVVAPAATASTASDTNNSTMIITTQTEERMKTPTVVDANSQGDGEEDEEEDEEEEDTEVRIAKRAKLDHETCV